MLSRDSALISVIVPVRDDAPGVRELLERLAVQTFPGDQFEVVIGDDGSEPGSLAAFASHDGRVRIESGPPRTSYAGRNRAAKVARGNVLAFCDSDCLPAADWLEQGLAALSRADIVAGEVTFIAPDDPTVWSILTIDMFLDQERNVRLAQGVTANLFLRRELFERLGGFDESLPSGGDYDLVRRSIDAGARLVYAPSAVVWHPTLDVRDKFMQKVWNTNRWAALRHARAGKRPTTLGLLGFVPVLGVAIARRRALRPIAGLERRRLMRSAVTLSKRQELGAILTLYFAVAYVAGLGRASGWWEGRRPAQHDAN